MNSGFLIDFEWLAREASSPAERATLAELTITVGARLATEVEDRLARAVRSSARLSAFDLALWFAANWWRLRWEPERRGLAWRMSHKIGAAGGGYLWPDLAFISDGEAVLVRSRPTPRSDAQPLRYLARFDEFLTVREFEDGVDQFIDGVIARLAEQRVNETELVDLWSEVRAERGDPERSAWRKLEALLGYDPDEAPSNLLDRLQESESEVGTEAVEELAAVAQDCAAADIDLLWHEVRPNAVQARLDNATALRRQISRRASKYPMPWQKAEEAARLARSAWRLDQGPLPTSVLADILSLPPAALGEQEYVSNSRYSAGFRDSEGLSLSIFLNKSHPTGRRFALARLVGDHLHVGSGERLLPATDAKTARQKFQRAFAQEFLCPFADLQAWLDTDEPGDEDIEAAAAHFDVSPLAVRSALVNKGQLDRGSLPS